MSGFRFLNSAAIYGANASGKSTVLRSMGWLRRFVLESFTDWQEDAAPPHAPFALDKKSGTAPTEVSLLFVVDETRHFYRVAVMPDHISDEELFAYPKGQPRLLYRRTASGPDADIAIELGKGFSLPGRIRRALRPNALVLSVAAEFRHRELLKIHEWFAMRFIDLSALPPLDEAAIIELARIDPRILDRLTGLLQRADLGIETLRLSRPRGGEARRLEVLHATERGKDIARPLETVSDGTRRLIDLSLRLEQVLEQNAFVFADDLDTHLHPHLLREILRGFQLRPGSTSTAQLLFTAHNTNLQSSGILRRDQIWFTEKEPGGATSLVSLADFRARKGESIERGYHAGRYGGIPLLEDGGLTG